MESSIHLEAIVIKQDGSVPVKYGLTLDMEARYSDIKPALSRLSRIPAESLILVEIVQSQFRISTASEEQKLKGLSGSCLFAYEFQPLKGFQRPSQSSTSKAPQTLSEIQRGTVARKHFVKLMGFDISSNLTSFFSEHHEDARNPKRGPNSSDTNSHVRASSEVSRWPAQICMSGISFCLSKV